MSIFKSHFVYPKSQRNGIFVLILLIVVLQSIIYFYKFKTDDIEVDPISISTQNQLDSLKQDQTKFKLKPFNPNYLSDYKAYQLGMSVKEIDRLFAYRKLDKFINSVEDFKKITHVSDSILNKIAPYFKFPDWVKTKQAKTKKTIVEKLIVKDINKGN